MKEERNTLHANGAEIVVVSRPNEADYISLTDIAKYRSDEPNDVIRNWMRGRDTIEFLGLWETLNNPDFKPVEFEGFRSQAGSNAFTLSPRKWIDETHAIGIVAKSGRYGGTYAHTDIAFEFASWISPEFKLYIIRDYQRLKTDEAHQQRLEWSAKRLITKANYRLHTDAVQKHLVQGDLTKKQISCVYADEADLLNVALFGMTAQEWRIQHPDARGNMRDEASVTELVVLANLESINAELIRQKMDQGERLISLRRIANYQMNTLEKSASADKLTNLIVPKRKALHDKSE